MVSTSSLKGGTDRVLIYDLFACSGADCVARRPSFDGKLVLPRPSPPISPTLIGTQFRANRLEQRPLNLDLFRRSSPSLKSDRHLFLLISGPIRDSATGHQTVNAQKRSS